MKEPDTPSEQDKGINRRDVLKSAATAGAIGAFGLPAFGGQVAAAPNGNFDHQFYAVEEYNDPKYLIGFDPDPDGAGYIAADAVALSDTLGLIGTLAFSPNGILYAIDIPSGTLVTIDVDTGTVTTKGTNAALSSVPGSAFLKNGSLYAVDKDSNQLVKVDPSDASTVSSSSLLVDDSWDQVAEGTPLDEIYGDYHIGLAVDFEEDKLYGVIGNTASPYGTNSDDELVQIATDGTVHLVKADVIPELRKVGVEYDPCANQLYAMRGGPNLWQVDETGENSQKVATVKLDGQNVNVASLASPYPTTVNCPCETALLAGQDIDVGTVTMELNGTTLTVTFQTDDDWYLSETHLEVVDDPDNFPTAGQNNPQVGQFSYGDTYGPGIQMDDFDVDVSGLSEPYYIAAHAVVYHVDCRTASPPSFWASTVAEKSLGTQKDGDPIPADRADATNALGAPDGDFLSLGFDEGYAVFEFDHPVYNGSGEADIFLQEVTFGRDTYPEELADVYVSPVDGDGFVYAGQVSNKDSYGSTPGLGAVGIPDGIVAVDAVKVVNATDPNNFTGSGGLGPDADGYDLDAVGANCLVDQEETAWGDGCAFNANGGNWATYFVYDGQNCGCPPF